MGYNCNRNIHLGQEMEDFSLSSKYLIRPNLAYLKKGIHFLLGLQTALLNTALQSVLVLQLVVINLENSSYVNLSSAKRFPNK